jgi:hypothetical protein
MNVRDALEQGHGSGYAVYREKACCLTRSTLYLAADRRKGSMTTVCKHLAEFFASPHAAQIMAGAATQVTGQDWGFISVGSVVPGPAPKACCGTETLCEPCQEESAGDLAHDIGRELVANNGVAGIAGSCPDCKSIDLRGDTDSAVCLECGARFGYCQVVAITAPRELVRLSDGRTLPVTITELALSQAREDAAEDELDEIVRAFHLPTDAPTFVFDGRA